MTTPSTASCFVSGIAGATYSPSTVGHGVSPRLDDVSMVLLTLHLGSFAS